MILPNWTFACTSGRAAFPRALGAPLLAAALGWVAPGACADVKRPLLDASLEQLLNVEVTSVSRQAQPLNEAPAAVTVIDRQMIIDSGAWDLADVLRLVPGMYVAYNTADTYSANSTVSFHGLTDAYARRMQVLVDGRSVYSPLFGGALWSDIPVLLDDIARIEVIRGPNSASYGANSFLGIINIITRAAGDAPGTTLSASLGQGRRDGFVRVGGKNGDLSYRVSVGLRSDDGEDANIVDPILPHIGWSTNKYDDKRIRVITLRAAYQINAHDNIELQLGYNGGPRQEGTNTDTFLPRWKTVDNHVQMLRWERNSGADNAMSLQFYHGFEGSTDQLTYRAFPELPALDADVAADRYDIEFQHNVISSEQTRLVWGASARLDRTVWPRFLNTRDPIDFRLARLFGNLEWRVRPDLLFNGGAMVEKNNFTGTDITPRVALNWHVTAQHTLRASHSRATRTPSLFEEKVDYRFRGPSGLPARLPQQADFILFKAVGGVRPERIAATDLAWLGRHGALEWDGRLFEERVRDMLAFYRRNPCPPGNPSFVAPGVLCVGTSSRDSRNSGNATVRGVEGQLNWRMSEHTRLVYGYSYARITSANEDNTTYSDSIPSNSHSLLFSHRINDAWSASLTAYRTGANHMPGSGSGIDSKYYFIEANKRLDARVAYRHTFGAINAELALTVQNLTDSRIFEYAYSNQFPGRKASASLKLSF